jgi:hypothetical protein
VDRKFLRPLTATVATLFAASGAHATANLGKAAEVIAAAKENGVAGASLTLAKAQTNGAAAMAYAHESHSSHSSHSSHASHSSHSSSSF